MARHLEGDWRIGHSYASTESGVIAAQIFTSSRIPDAGIVAVGRPVDGVEVCIKNETGELAPPGEIGEIVVRSQFLAPGYWNNPDLTAKVFQTDPLNSAIRTYRTGDLGRFRSDGALEHLGRKGRKIKLRGYSVEPVQLECELMCQPGVSDAAVMLHDGADGQGPCLVGYVVASSNASASAIRKALAERLPSYMVPAYVVVLDSFPIASSGKIDRNALPPPCREKARLVTFRAPSGDYEHELLAIWQDVLKVPNIGVDDDFFELGGDSLQALTVFLEVEAQLGRSLSPTAMIQAPTIARLAELIRTTGIEAFQSLLPLRTFGTGLPLFLVGVFSSRAHYRHLVSNLKTNRPVFGLQLPSVDGRHRIPRTIESMAADFVTEIRRGQPHGPYLLAGHSFGGRVSFEIAQQLVGEGERVGFLGLIDTSFYGETAQVSEAVRLSRKIRHVHGFKDLLFRGLRYLHFRGLSYTRYLQRGLVSDLLSYTRYVQRELVLDLWWRLGGSIPSKYRLIHYNWLRRRARRKYVHKPYTGHITMFSSAGNSERHRAGWEPLALGGLTVLEVPAGHSDMVRLPHCKLLAEHFDACLDAAALGE
jgi:thioesterase domain-containing protein/acyl carrier protein